MIKSDNSVFRFYALLIIFCICKNSYTQTSTSNPYSYYALGIIENNGFCENNGAGSSGIAMPSKYFLNPTNPASYSTLDKGFFNFYIGTYAKLVTFKSNGIKQKDFESNIRYAAIGFKISNRWGSSLGLLPYSSRGYYITSKNPVEGDVSEYTLVSKGSGGLNRFYLSNSFRIVKNLSIGINASYLFGILRNEEQISNYDEYFNNITNTTTTYFRNVFFDFGIQYNLKIGNYNILTGLTYNPLQNLKTSYDKTVLNNSNTVYNESGVNKVFNIPSALGVGLGINFNNGLKIMCDYKFERWSKNNYQEKVAKLSDSWQVNTGAEYSNNMNNGKSYWDYVTFRTGFRFEKSYLNISGRPINDVALTLGASFPIKHSRSTINFSYEYGSMGTTENGLIRESYHRLTLGLSLNDLWFQKRKFE